MSCCEKNSTTNVRNDVKEYYGKTLQTSDDLKTNACVTPSVRMKKHVSQAMKLIHDEVVMKYYGCGLVIPECLEGMNILDLGSGSGRDCYVLSKLVGEDGFVTGIDMTDEQLETANKYIEHHRDVFGFKKSNVKFVKGYIENLKEAGIESNSVDIIISNCVINLCKDKKSVLQEAYRVLKEGGELYFSDVYADRELDEEIRSHKVLWGECVSGALHWEQLFTLAEEIGFETPRTVHASPIEISKPELKAVVGDARFISVLYRLFKLNPNAKREVAKVMYSGEITEYGDEIKFDHQTTFVKDTPLTVDGNTVAILQCSRFKDEFEFSKPSCCSNPSKAGRIDPFTLLSTTESKPSCQPGSKCC